MKKLIPNRLSLGLFFAGFICLSIYAALGSHVSDDGILIEPFGLIPLFWIFEILAITAYIVHLAKGFTSR
ncbi:hypothetical protein GCM10007938_21850 [Vibrio zhanjiangensis]|uniref:DUF3955 domain-containing protein n=1 Tax=Vibrio zhanjiangensis TaxID=1046128 RepID=A0ABQ6F0K3_9VIBR|nr:DUF3955 domain-containing protein [Vibrio zhanjiangensis]GLT18406.1 hypothetical protein GCM10007938_21850 [Vibrio zhanjiangensis]